MCLETTWSCTTIHLFSSQTCCVTPAKDAHILRVAPPECQRGSAATPTLRATAPAVPVPLGKDAHRHQSSPSQHNSSQLQPGNAKETGLWPTPIGSKIVWGIDPAPAPNQAVGLGSPSQNTAFCSKQPGTWCSLRAKSLHFTRFGLDLSPLIQNNVLLAYFSLHYFQKKNAKTPSKITVIWTYKISPLKSLSSCISGHPCILSKRNYYLLQCRWFSCTGS